MPGQNKEEKQMLFSVTTNRWSMALVLLIGPALSAGAHVGGRVFPIPELTDEMLAEIQLDGFVEEWSDLIGEPTLTLLDFTHGGGGASIRRISTSGSGWPGTMIRLVSMQPWWSPMTFTRILTLTMWIGPPH